jgi:predicted ATPase
VTLIGPGGTGKTRLALEAASSLVSEYKAGVFWVGLASLRDHALVTETISQTLGAKDGLAEHIAEREMLLLLDNLEQVIEAAPDLSSLLQACPSLAILVTSRELLRVQGEVEYPVPPLAEPEAVALFCERAQLSPSEEIAELCARLDNLPLAVELAAARTKALSPAQILERLSQRLDLLKGGRDADPRQQTLRATIEWSYDLLSPGEQQLFARLSVFAGGCALEAAEEVADADLDTLQSLVEKSLLRFSTERYWMLETIGEYAGERLDASRDYERLRQRHAEFFVAITRGANEALQTTDAERWLRLLDSEHNNLRAALPWMIRVGRIDSYLDLIGQIWRFWTVRGAWIEGRRWVDAGLAGSEGTRSGRRAVALRVAAVLDLQLGELEAARTHGEESLSIRRELGDPEEIAQGLSILAKLAADQGDYEESERLIEEAAALWRGGAATSAMRAGSLADLAMRRGDYTRAIALNEESLALFRKLERDDGTSWALYQLAFCLSRVGRHEEALSFAGQALTLTQRIGEVESLIWLFVLIGSLEVQRMEFEAGAMLLGAADALRERVGLALTGAEADLHRETIAQLRGAVGGERYDALHSDGRTMSGGDAVQYALNSLD